MKEIRETVESYFAKRSQPDGGLKRSDFFNIEMNIRSIPCVARKI